MQVDPGNLDIKDSYRLLVSAVVPRPIAWVSTVGEDGVFNLAPFSIFTLICPRPALIGLGIGRTKDGQKKDTLRNIESTGEFVINVVDETLAETMNVTAAAYPGDVDEFKEAGMTPAKADLVRAPMVGESPLNMECRLVQILEFGEVPRNVSFIIGEVLRVHIKDELYADGAIQVSKLRATGRLAAELYCRTTDIFEMKRPIDFS